MAVTRNPHYYRLSRARFLCLREAFLEEFDGDAIITSANPRFEGTQRKNWWGFAGKQSADASLHNLYTDNKGESRLALHCRRELRKQNNLRPGTLLLTKTADCYRHAR